MKHARPDYDRFQDPHGLIPADEPVLLLRGQDKHAADTLRYYAWQVASDPSADPREALRIVAAVLQHAHRMDKWGIKKSPDLPDEL